MNESKSRSTREQRCGHEHVRRVGLITLVAVALLAGACGDTGSARRGEVVDVVETLRAVAAVEAFRSKLSGAAVLERVGERYIVAGNSGRQKGKIAASAPVTADGPMRLEAPGQEELWIELAAVGRASVQAVEHGVLVYPDAEPATDVVVVLGRQGFEELRVLRSAAAPSTSRYRLRMGAAVGSVQVHGGQVVVTDERGRVAFKTLPAYAVDARGVRRALSMSLEGDVLVASLDTRGLSYPVIFDPAWTHGFGFATETISHSTA